MEFSKRRLKKMFTATMRVLLCCGFLSLACGTPELDKRVPTRTTRDISKLTRIEDKDLQKRFVNSELLGDMRRKRNIFETGENPYSAPRGAEMRQKRQSISLTPLNFLFLMPYEKASIFNLPLTSAAISLAFYKVRSLNLLPAYDLKFTMKNSQCSVAVAMLEAIDAHTSQTVDVFIGPVCDYALAPVARQSAYWQIPVLSPGGFADDFDDKIIYPLLIRSGMNFQTMSNMTLSLMDVFGWKKVKIFYDPNGYNNIMDGFCKNAAASLTKAIASDPTKITSYNRVTDIDLFLSQMESEIGDQWAVIVLCLNPDDVREIMIKAHQLGFNKGHHVFINIDLFSSKQSLESSWYRQNETDESNMQAKKGSQALMTLTLQKPSGVEFRFFSEEVKKRAKDMSPMFVEEEEVNYFVTAIHDSVLLYAMALNETLEANLSLSNGVAISNRMKNRTFEGIGGTVHIDENGARSADFSLLDLNPATNKFEVVSNYNGKKGNYEFVVGKSIDWGEGKTTPPSDTPDVPVCTDSICSEQQSECNVGYYGDKCNKSCSVNCAGSNHPCHPVNGSCAEGCVAGYSGDMCTQEIKEDEEEKDCKDSGIQAANIATVVVVGVVAIVVAFMAGVFVGRRRSSSNLRTNQEEGVALNAVKS